MNHRITFYLALLASFILVGCSNTSNSSSSPSSSNTSSSSTSNNTHYNADNFITPTNNVTATKLVTYPGPSILSSSSKVSLKVDDTDVFVYETRVNYNRSFTYDYSSDKAPVAIFDFEGLVHVSLTFNEVSSITSSTVSPLVYGISPKINGNTISFDLANPDDYVVEINGDYKSAVHLFTSLPESNPLTEEAAKKDSSITYFGPGVYKVDAIPVSSNSTIYLAGGAYVYGQIVCADLENVTIRGRGIFDGEIYERKVASEKEIPFEFSRSKNITIDGISVLDPAGWAIAIINSDSITINNVRVISARANGDGISLQSCKNATVTNCFVRSWDDSLVVKNVNRGTTKNVTFSNVKVWTDLAQSMEVGYETNGATMEDITFENITVIHNFHKAAMSIHNCDDAAIDNVNFKNITIEDGEMLGDVQDDGDNDFLIDMTIAYNAEWTKSGGKRGKVTNVTFSNINVYHLASSIVSRLKGEDADSCIDGVKFENVYIEGKLVSKAEDFSLTTNDYVKNLSYSTNSNPNGAIITLNYKNSSDGSTPSISQASGLSQKGILVPSEFQNKSTQSYIGEKCDVSSAMVSVTHGLGSTTTAEADDGSGSYISNGSSVSALIDNNRETTFSSLDYKGGSDEFIAITVTFASKTRIGVIRLLGAFDNDFYTRYSVSLYGRKPKSDGSENSKFLRVLASNNYEITPASGNYVDMSFTTAEYYALQLRFFKKDALGYQNKVELSDLVFYPPSLTYNKSIVSSTESYDVYDVSKINDGDPNGTSYYESASLPAHVIIDMGDLYTINYVVMCLPGIMSWTARVENIEVLVSSSNSSYSETTTFTTLVAAKDYTFDPSKGNMQILDVTSSKAQARFIEVIITSNSASGNYGAQLSELSVYGA